MHADYQMYGQNQCGDGGGGVGNAMFGADSGNIFSNEFLKHILINAAIK